MSFIVWTFSLLLMANAYIPSADFIVSKATKNSGNGPYQIQQDLTFSLPDRNLTLTETWWVAGPNLMFLKVDGLPFTQYYLYTGTKRMSFNSEKQSISSRISPFFLEPFFFYRNAREFKDALLQKKLTPAATFRKRPTFKNSQDLLNWEEPFLTLSRLNGVVTYLLGSPIKDANQSGVWFEQDRFTIRKIKIKTDAEITVDSISELSRSLTFPKNRSYSWDTHSVQSELIRGDSIKNIPKFTKETEFVGLASKVRPLPPELKGTVVEEFYLRFR